MREAPSRIVIKALPMRGAEVVAHDPVLAEQDDKSGDQEIDGPDCRITAEGVRDGHGAALLGHEKSTGQRRLRAAQHHHPLPSMAFAATNGRRQLKQARNDGPAPKDHQDDLELEHERKPARFETY